MPRANRHHQPGYVWHITHRCHRRQFLLRFARDRRDWVRWLYQARRRFGLCVFDYCVTSNHIHSSGGPDIVAYAAHLGFTHRTQLRLPGPSSSTSGLGLQSSGSGIPGSFLKPEARGPRPEAQAKSSQTLRFECAAAHHRRTNAGLRWVHVLRVLDSLAGARYTTGTFFQMIHVAQGRSRGACGRSVDEETA